MPSPNSQASLCDLKLVKAKLMDIQPENPPTDPKCRLWYERVKCSRCETIINFRGLERSDAIRYLSRRIQRRFDPLLPFLQAIFVLLDIGFDLKVAVTHYQHGDYNWTAYTVIIVVVSLIFVQAVSVFFFIEDKSDDSQKRDALKENGVVVKRWTLICHLFLLGRFVRFYQMWKVARNIRRQGCHNVENDEEARQQFVRRHILYISQTADSNTLGLIEGFLENAPQVMLQFYILLGQSHVDLTSSDDLLVTLNIVKSLLLFAFSHLQYARALRQQGAESAQLEWLSKGAVSLYLWRLFMLVSRVLVLALFASTFVGYFTVLLIAVRFLVFLRIVGKQHCDYFEDNRKMRYLLKLAVAYIHMFSFFPLISEKTKRLGIVYYGITFVENSAILVLWVFLSTWGRAFKIGTVVVEKIFFAFGLACLALYYGRFHPSIVQTTADKVDRQTTEESSSYYLCVSSV